MAISSFIREEPGYYERRHREFVECMRPFSQMLAHIHLYSRPALIFHYNTGELETILDEHSQKLIDKVIKDRDNYIKESFPEFYNPE